MHIIVSLLSWDGSERGLVWICRLRIWFRMSWRQLTLFWWTRAIRSQRNILSCWRNSGWRMLRNCAVSLMKPSTRQLSFALTVCYYSKRVSLNGIVVAWRYLAALYASSVYAVETHVCLFVFSSHSVLSHGSWTHQAERQLWDSLVFSCKGFSKIPMGSSWTGVTSTHG